MSSNDTSIRQLQLATEYIAIAIGFPILIAGIIGNFLNILVFLTLGNYKTNASSFYMLAKSIFDLSALIFGLIGHILIQGFRSSAMTSETWCRIRIPLLYISSLSSYTCLCLQSIDSFLCSSRNAVLRQQSTVQRGRYLILGFLFLWFCNECPYYFMQQLSIIPNWRCQTTNTLYAQYRSYFTILTLSVIAPIVITSLFGYLSYRNLRLSNLNRQPTVSNFSRQMISMTLLAILIVVIFQLPYTIAQLYFTATANYSKSIYRQTQEQLANVFFFIYTYNACVSSFYAYCIASQRFRQQVVQVLKQLKTIFQRRNQVLPFTETGRAATQQKTTEL
ncbi:unnamed protein product [Adineta steineri]|uniref:G-protein coupled receptors family 1 profile domain-containing protein n=1 Tax=Adineta steineri TaxID=433720 RepID=A0A814QH74_9BILA|nr:unnamed protein product [Adineta steineri]CAF3541499.1 unnamed protein product [Adineta steineri]